MLAMSLQPMFRLGLVSTSDETEIATDGWGQRLTPIRIDLSDYTPSVLVSFPMPSLPAVVDKGPFAELIPAHLVLFYSIRRS